MESGRPTLLVDINETVDRAAEGEIGREHNLLINERFGYRSAYKPKEGFADLSETLQRLARDFDILPWTSEPLVNQIAWLKRMGVINKGYVVAKELDKPIRASRVSRNHPELLYTNRSGIHRIKYPYLEQFEIDMNNAIWFEDRRTIGQPDGLYGDHEFFLDNPQWEDQYVGIGKLEPLRGNIAETRARLKALHSEGKLFLRNEDQIDDLHMLPANETPAALDRLNSAIEKFMIKRMMLSTSVKTKAAVTVT